MCAIYDFRYSVLSLGGNFFHHSWKFIGGHHLTLKPLVESSVLNTAEELMTAMKGLKFAVITVSDTCSKDKTLDKSGPRLVNLINAAFDEPHIDTDIIPDEHSIIEFALRKLIQQKVSVIITTGGTGFAPRDVTPEATKAVLTKDCPQLTLAISLASLQKTKFAALSRGICGIAGKTLILNFPGSEKAVVECFESVRDVLPHAVQLIADDLPQVRNVHASIKAEMTSSHSSVLPLGHVCPHKTGRGDGVDRNSPYPMIRVAEALQIIYQTVIAKHEISQFLNNFLAPVNIPPFRASIKDGYAMKSTGFSGSKKVLGYIAAGDEINFRDLEEDECYKINTGAPIPHHADCVVQVEDTKLLKTKKNGDEDLVEILIEPTANLDIRPIGCDLSEGSKLFPSVDHSDVVIKSILASVGETLPVSFRKPQIAIISTGSELLAPKEVNVAGKIYDSNTTMLQQLLEYFGFECKSTLVLSDDFETVQRSVADLFEVVDFVICSGGVSMGDKDYIKPVLEKLDFAIHFGRVNMKPGKPMTFASRGEKYFFGLPGNPVSAFVTFHLFALPAIRWSAGWQREKCELPTLQVTLRYDSLALNPRPEYVRASITSANGQLFATINGNQMSSRLQSIVGADVLLHCPGRTETKTHIVAGDTLTASVLRYDFISHFE